MNEDKIMKKLCISLLFPLLLCGCVQRDEDGIDASGISGYSDDVLTISTVKYGYIEHNPTAIIDYSDYKSLDTLSMGKDYLMVYEFSYAPGKDSRGTYNLMATVTFISPQGEFTLWDADTTIAPHYSTEDIHGQKATQVTLTYPISESGKEFYKQQVVFRLAQPESGEGQVTIRFSTNAGTISGGGKEGFSHYVKVE